MWNITVGWYLNPRYVATTLALSYSNEYGGLSYIFVCFDYYIGMEWNVAISTLRFHSGGLINFQFFWWTL